MLQNKQTLSFLNSRRWLLMLAAVVVGLSFIVFNPVGTRAYQQPDANSASPKPRTKRLTPLRTSETPDGSRVTITSDGELNDYSAYRSGDRFIVVVPQAEGAGGSAKGRGFEGAQVERRGKDLVYTFKLQPGATARVNQRFNRLDVQFSAPKTAGGQTQASNNANVRPAATPAPTPKPTRSPLPEEAGIVKTPANSNTQPTPDANINKVAANSTPTPLAVASPNINAVLPGEVVPTPTLAPTSTPLNPEQLAQAQPTSAAPVSITTNAPATASPSVGAVVLRNWPWLIAALLAVGIGLIFVARFTGDRDGRKSLPPSAAPSSTKPAAVKETKTPELKPATASITPPVSTASTTSTATTAAAIAASTAAATANSAAVTGGKQSKKQKKKAEKSKQLAAANERKKAGAATATGASTANKTTKEADAGTAASTGAIIAAGAASLVASGAQEVEESKTVETKAIEVEAMPPKVVEPSIAFDPDRIEVEIKKLLAGENYDEKYINATEEGTRQLVSAELMQAIAGRNEVRQRHARAAFLKHGYFDEATRALQSAEAPGERAAAARTLGLIGDRSATVHLTAALEDPAADVRRTSVEALAELQDPAAVGALEALRWRETSRQVPRALIQRAIEASKTAENVEDVKASPVADDDTPTLVNAKQGSLSSPLSVTEAPVVERDETASEAGETKEIELSFAAKPLVSSTASPLVKEFDTRIEELSRDEASEASAAVTPDASVALEETPIVETKPARYEIKAAPEEPKAIELVEPKALDIVIPDAKPELAEEPVEKVETAATSVKTDVAAMLAAKEAGLIEAREKQDRELAESAKATKAIEPVVAPLTVEPTSTSLESTAVDVQELTIETPSVKPQSASIVSSLAPTTAEAANTETTKQADAESQTAYQSDFKVGSDQQQPIPETGRQEPASLFDSLEIEPFEPKVAAPITAPPVDLERFEHTREQQPLTAVTQKPVASAADEHLRDAETVTTEKGLSLADGSDEDNYSIIPKGIQVRLASDDASERAASLLALSQLNTDEAFSEICAGFDDRQEEVRNAAARALYDLNEDRAESFTRALRESPVERRRQIGAALASSGLADEAIGNLTGESRDKTYDAFSLLFLMAKAGEVAPLIHAIESHADNEVRLAVVKLLALSGQQEILPAFRRLAVRGSLPAEVRSAVMEAIYQISSQPQSATHS